MDKNRTLLFVDDEPNILSALKRVFFEDDFEILTAESGKKALEMVKDNEVQLIISDQRMPEMVGSELLAKVREMSPDIMRIILTGFADMDAAVDAINNGQIYQFIFKPWNDEELRSVVLRALEHYDLQAENRRLLSELKKANAELEDLNSKLSQKVKERTALIVQKNLELGKLNKSLESSLVSTVRVFINLLEMSRPEVSRHARRVATLATTMAKEMDWGEKRIGDMEIAALIHDIGKIGIPESILRKSRDEMTDGEMKALNNHPILGQNTIGAIDSFQHIGKIIRAHHEQWNGKGYPDGLSGEDIPIEARLLSVCNIYDHLEEEEDHSREHVGEQIV
jgi:response regulator RpfG family c-di-GMP phosphodiesterase